MDKSNADNELLAAVRLIRTEGIGPVTFHRLVQRANGSACEALKILPELAARGGRKKPYIIYDAAKAESEIEEARSKGAHLIPIWDDHYPNQLREIDDAPPLLYVKGDLTILNKSPSVALVGARNASAHAKKFTTNIARELGAKGCVITSGFARGIDTAAHNGALLTGTIAVFAGGLGKPYPQENIRLIDEVCETGAIISECPWGESPTSRHFPKRNRIVSGLSQAVVVVEASIKSGSLITARMAAEQGRDVFAVPGFPGDPRASGPNSLIRDGAILVSDAQDILNELQQFHIPDQPELTLSEDTQEPLAQDDRSREEVFQFKHSSRGQHVFACCDPADR